jgi:hypothetical protein
MRRTYIYFCKAVVNLMPRDYFKAHFLKGYLEASHDKVSNVRRECANASVIIRQFYEHDVDLSLELMEVVNRLS